LPWLVEILNGVKHANFFEQRATECSKGASRGSWDGEEGVGEVRPPVAGGLGQRMIPKSAQRFSEKIRSGKQAAQMRVAEPGPAGLAVIDEDLREEVHSVRQKD
jgi:hypothetical protein